MAFVSGVVSKWGPILLRLASLCALAVLGCAHGKQEVREGGLASAGGVAGSSAGVTQDSAGAQAASTPSSASSKRRPILLAAFTKADQGTQVDPAAGRKEYEQAEVLFRDEQYTQAEAAFRRVARRYKDTSVEEDALFMVAECEYLTERYPKAQDSYERLLQKYENTRHLDKATQRLFAIARHWLKHVVESKGPLPVRLPVPNLTDRSRPLLDREGRGLEALTSIRLHDPTGLLADDALMMTATYHFLRGNYEDADFYFQTLRQDYPDSEHQPLAHLLGTRAKLRAYQGPQYDGQQLEGAEKLLQSTLRQFPELEEERPNLLRSLEAVRQQKAERLWETAEYYRRSRHPESARICDRMLVNRYPDTQWAVRARERLGETAVEPAEGKE